MTVLKIKERLNSEFDRVIEDCLNEKLPVRQALRRVLPVICRIIGAEQMMIRTMDEELSPFVFRSKGFRKEWASDLPAVLPETGFPPRTLSLEEAHIVTVSLDVTDRLIGVCAFAFPGGTGPGILGIRADLAETAAEHLDNYLEGIASGARKQMIAMESTEALRSRIFEEGADKAVSLLCRELALEEFVLIYGDSDAPSGAELRYRFYRNGEMKHNSIEDDEKAFLDLLERPEKTLNPEDRSFSALIEKGGVQEKPLRNGLNSTLIGKLVFRSRKGGLTPEGRDIIEIFAECLCQRLFDYNRERRSLAKCFCARDVQRLLGEPDFYNRWLSPREEDIVILYSDISSFTSICEKVLDSASAVGDLINRWSRLVLEILYRYDGVFDKMVGDCVIGLFGPPFFESPMENRTEKAVAAAVRIVEATEALGRETGLEERIRKAGVADRLTTSNGIHCGLTSVGFFGPNEDYTGFSSAMNHTARLQGHASSGEILISSAALDKLSGGPLGIAPERDLAVDFAGPWEIAVKNVTRPLEFYRCLYDKEN